MKAKFGALFASLALCVPFVPAQASTEGDVVDALSRIRDFDVLARAAIQAGLLGDLQTSDPITVFAPTDAAFAALPAETVQALVDDPSLLMSVLAYHVVPLEAFAADAALLDSAPTLLPGQSVEISGNLSRGLKIDDANVIFADIDVSNGVIHVIDRVLIPDL